MRRALIGQGNRSPLRLALSLAGQQHVDASCQPGDFALLSGHDPRKIVGNPRQMGDSLFQPLGSLQRLLVHASSIR